MVKLLLLHGAGLTNSRTKLAEIKKEFDPNDVIVFEEGASIESIKNNLSASPLFSDNRLVILENPDNFQTGAFTSLSFTLVLWFDRQVDTKKYPGATTFFFPEEKEISVFPFLDSLADKDKGAYLKLDKLKQAGLDTQYIITMMLYLLRSLVALKKNAPAFVKEKTQRQRKNFPPDEIIKFYKFILETDFRIKSGFLEENQAELMLVDRFMANH